MKLLWIVCLMFWMRTGKCDSLELEQDPFKALGIPEFNLNIDSKPKEPQIPRLESIDDLPAFVESSYFNTKQGVNMLTKFLTEDDDQLKENGGIYDQTGFDGLDKSEDIYPKNTVMRNKQRARSAVNLYVKYNDPNDKYEAYGCVDNDQDDNSSAPQGWLQFTVLLMTPEGEHKMLKSCLPQDEKNNIVFVGETDIKCQDKVKVAKEIRERTKNYFEKSGLGSKIQERLGINIFEDYSETKSPPEKKEDSTLTNKDTRDSSKDDVKEKKQEKKKDDTVSQLQKQIKDLQNQLQGFVKNTSKQKLINKGKQFFKNNMRFKQKNNDTDENKDSNEDNKTSNDDSKTTTDDNKTTIDDNKTTTNDSKITTDDNKQDNTDEKTNNGSDDSQQSTKKSENEEKSKSKKNKQTKQDDTTNVALQQMIKMQEEFKKHDQLMENEIKLLKEEVQTLKGKDKTKKKDTDVQDGIAALLQKKIKAK